MKLVNQRRSKHLSKTAHKRGKNKLRARKKKLSSKTISGIPGNI